MTTKQNTFKQDKEPVNPIGGIRLNPPVFEDITQQIRDKQPKNTFNRLIADVIRVR